MRAAVNFRLARGSDGPSLAKLARAFAEENPSPSRTANRDLPQAAQAVSRILAQAAATVLVAEKDNELVAMMIATSMPSLVHGGRPILFIELLVVAKKHRRLGIGSGLVQEAVELAQSQGAYKVSLITAIDNDGAKAMYEKFGFSANGIALAYYMEG